MLTLANLDKFREDISKFSFEDLAALRRTLNNQWDRKEFEVAAELELGVLVGNNDTQGLTQLGVVTVVNQRLVGVKDHEGKFHNFVSSRLIQVL